MSMLEGKSRGARDARKAEAEETMQIIEQGGYVAPDGTYVEIGEAIEEAVVGSYCYGEHEMPQYSSNRNGMVETTYDVVNAGCVETAQALASAGYRCTMLNFASAKNPGGPSRPSPPRMREHRAVRDWFQGVAAFERHRQSRG